MGNSSQTKNTTSEAIYTKLLNSFWKIHNKVSKIINKLPESNYLSNLFQKGFRWTETFFWVFIAIWVGTNTLNMVLGNIAVQEFNDLLAYEVFWTIIGFEVVKMAYFRLIGKTTLLFLYHFSVLVVLAFCRQIVLKHDLELIYVLGLLGSVVATIILREVSHQESLFPRIFGKNKESW